MNIIALKLITGEEVLGEVQSQTETEFILENPVAISIVRGPDGKPNVGFSPFPLHSPQKMGDIISLSKKHIVYDYVPAEDFIKNYESIFGAGIILPPQKSLITG